MMSAMESVEINLGEARWFQGDTQKDFEIKLFEKQAFQALEDLREELVVAEKLVNDYKKEYL